MVVEEEGDVDRRFLYTRRGNVFLHPHFELGETNSRYNVNIIEMTIQHHVPVLYYNSPVFE